MPANAKSTTASTAAVTMRVKTAECASSSAACKPKNRLRLLAQSLMCEASAAVSVDTKSRERPLFAEGVVKVVMVCSRCIKGGNFTALCWITEFARFSLEFILRKYPWLTHQTLLLLM